MNINDKEKDQMEREGMRVVMATMIDMAYTSDGLSSQVTHSRSRLIFPPVFGPYRNWYVVLPPAQKEKDGKLVL